MDLFGRLRTKILSLFFLNENRDFYIREVAAIIDASPRGAQIELIKLEKDGILQSEMRGKQRYFSVNPKNPSYQEIRGLVLKKYGIPHLVKEALSGIPQVREAFIYGSYAKGEEDYSSDIDCFIIAEKKIEYGLLSDRFSKLEDQFRREINFDIMSEREYKRKLADGDPYITSIDEGEKIYLIGESAAEGRAE